jgi:protein involved in polysaccharide export with SLBB domain
MLQRLPARPLRRLAVAALLLLAPSAPVAAQQIDPSVLQRVQGQLGAGQQGTGSADLDAARERGDVRDQAEIERGATAEELEVRRQRSRRVLETLYRPSAVEREYQERLGDRTLRQFGYDLFRVAEGGSGPLTGQVSDNYILGVGDEVVVSFQGATNDSRTVRVDREGRIVAGNLPPIRAAGRSLGAVRAELAAATRRTLLGTDIYVSLGAVRAISIFVGGEVERPGQYQMTSLGDIATALARAGGVRRNGSLRQIRVVRAGGGVQTVDLYGLLGIGAPSSVRLQDGDRVIVPVIGKTVAVSGAVARPGIYELRGSVSVAALVDYAGGALRSRGYQVAISRFNADGSETFVRSVGGGQLAQAGDALQVSGGSAGGVAGRVSVEGFVSNAGARSIVSAPTVRDLVGDLGDLRLGTYTPFAVISRRDPASSLQSYVPVSLIEALGPGTGVRLQGDDRLFVFGRDDIAFLNLPVVRRVASGERNTLPQCRSLERLAAQVRSLGSARFAAISRGVYTVEATQGELRRRDSANVAPTATGANAQPESRAEQDDRLRRSQLDDGLSVDEREALLRAQARNERLLREGAEVDPAAVASVDGEADTDICPTVFEREPDLLPVLIENLVAVGGAVRAPGLYPVAGNVPASALIAAAGGMATQVGGVTLDVNRNSAPVPALERVAFGGAAAMPSVIAGDDLFVNAQQPQFEAGAVRLTGEVARPGTYTLRRGETLSQLLARAGGLTPQGYAYGGIFTRKAVRDAQREAFARTARELNTSLLATISRRGAQAGSLAGLTEIVDRLSSADPVGRMVIEADPQVLAVRPELDTVLQGGDALHVPKRPNYVLALGDVNNPGALQFVSGRSARDYLRDAGGSLASADDGRAFLVLPNGVAQPLKGSIFRRGGNVVPPGSSVVVPKDIDPSRTLDLVTAATTVFGQLATSIASIAILATQ